MALRTRVLASHVVGASAAGADSTAAAQLTEDLLRSVTRDCPGYEETLERNWNGNVRFFGKPVVPGSLDELRAVVRDGETPIRVVGRGHSFAPLAECAGGTLVSLARLNHVLDFTPPAKDRVGSITIEGGTTYTEVAQFLGRGGALRNLPSCSQFTVAGSIATATHGSGVHIQNLAADVCAIEFVKADGSLVRYSRQDSPELLEGSRVHLGCLGVVSRLTLDVVPFFEVESFRYDDALLEPVIDQLPNLWQLCDSLSVWTAGFGQGPGNGRCWVQFRHFAPHWDTSLAAPAHSKPDVLKGTALREAPLIRYCTDPREPVFFNVSGKKPWHDALTQTMDEGQETTMVTVDMQAEFFVPLPTAQAAIHAVWKVAQDWTFSSPHGCHGEPVEGLVNAMEFRQVKGDSAWLSPHPVDSLGIHVSFNGKHEWQLEVLRVLPSLERALRPFGARAHWGKLAPLTCSPSRVEELYADGVARFRALCDVHDPTGKFRNAHVRHMLFAGPR